MRLGTLMLTCLCLTGLAAPACAHLHPGQGRFVQRDPAGYAPGMNAYSLADANPIGRLDPAGKEWFPISWFPKTGPGIGHLIYPSRCSSAWGRWYCEFVSEDNSQCELDDGGNQTPGALKVCKYFCEAEGTLAQVANGNNWRTVPCGYPCPPPPRGYMVASTCPTMPTS